MEQMQDTVLVFEGAEGWRIWLAVALACTSLWLVWLGLRSSESRARRLWLSGLRALGLLALALLLLQLSLQERQLSPIKRRLAVLVDGSASMEFGAGADGSRAARVAGFLDDQRQELSRLGERFELDFYRFAGRPQTAAREGIADRPDGLQTDLLAALEGVRDAADGGGRGGESLAGVILISDGADTAQLLDVPPGGGWPKNAVEQLEAYPVPVNALAVAATDGFMDLAISDVRTDDFAFIRNAVEVEVLVQSFGIKEQTVPVVLEQEGRNLAVSSVRIGPGESRRVKLKFVPDRVGKFVYRVYLPHLPDDQLPENDERTFVSRIIRDKIRVLHLVGRPSWDERFLRQVLKRNPNIDLISFFILRTITDDPGVSPDELSLIPFPVADLFGTELPTFDLVIFQNFNHGPYQVALYLPQLREYVYEGGSFLMIGGDLSFGAGGYAATPMAEVLPVSLTGGVDTRVGEFRVQPTEAGLSHPILDLGDERIFDTLPPLGSFNLAAGLEPGAQVLLAHPFERSAEQAAPILAIREVGRGRTAAVMSDGTWRWNFVYAGQGGTPRPYHRFYNNLMRWLIQDPGLQTVWLRADKTHWQAQEPVQLSARLAGATTGAKVNVELLEADSGRVVARQLIQADETGRARVEFGGLSPGSYLARMEIQSPGRGVERAEEALVVGGGGLERSRAAPRADLLERIADITGGRYANLASGSLADLEIDADQRYRVEASVTRPLLGHAWAICLLVCLLALEWWLRRRWGFA